ncbi:MAG: response regulator transcription factor, partial [Armatimonadota bacterium]
MTQPGKPIILAVDDDPRMLESIERTLSDVDCTLLTATDGASALSTATAERAPDLLILDRMLPDVDGVELLGHLRAQGIASPA